MVGYLNNPEATASTIRGSDGYMHTGDIARFKNGWLYITDRSKVSQPVI